MKTGRGRRGGGAARLKSTTFAAIEAGQQRGTSGAQGKGSGADGQKRGI
jgi:hypothetical protein